MVAVSPSERVHVKTCPACGGGEFRPLVRVGEHAVVRCAACGLGLTNPQPSDAELAAIYGPDYVLAEDSDAAGAAMVLRSKRATADHYLDLLAGFIGDAAPSPRSSAGRGGDAAAPTRGALLEIGCGAGNFLRQAAARGFEVTGVEYSPFAAERARKNLEGKGRVLVGEITVLASERDAYDVCVLCDVIEHVRDPGGFLREILRLLRPGGVLLVVTPSLASWSARLLGARWMEFKAEHLYYFSPSTISRQLARAGFGEIALRRGVKKLSFDYVAAHFKKYPVTGVTPVVGALHAITPARLSAHLFSVVASGLIALARKPA
jgi:SAM-dependent methyltransferase